MFSHSKHSCVSGTYRERKRNVNIATALVWAINL